MNQRGRDSQAGGEMEAADRPSLWQRPKTDKSRCPSSFQAITNKCRCNDRVTSPDCLPSIATWPRSIETRRDHREHPSWLGNGSRFRGLSFRWLFHSLRRRRRNAIVFVKDGTRARSARQERSSTNRPASSTENSVFATSRQLDTKQRDDDRYNGKNAESLLGSFFKRTKLASCLHFVDRATQFLFGPNQRFEQLPTDDCGHGFNRTVVSFAIALRKTRWRSLAARTTLYSGARYHDRSRTKGNCRREMLYQIADTRSRSGFSR